MKRLYRIVTAVVVTGGCCLIQAQSPIWSNPPLTTGTPRLGDPRSDRDEPHPLPPGTQERLEKGRQTERQRKMIADTDRLLALATQLKADMDKTTKDTLSVDVIKKAEEIEKLAHSVKERMKG